MAKRFRVGEEVKISRVAQAYHQGNRTGVVKEITDGGDGYRVLLDLTKTTISMHRMDIEKK